MSRSVPRSVFVVGCGRSGTTLAYEMLCNHPDFSWISNWCDRTGLPQLARFNRWYEHAGARRAARTHPQPSEGRRVWDKVLPEYAGAGSPMLSTADLTPAMSERLRQMVSDYTRFGGGRIFLNKNTRNTRRISFLGEAFPTAVFVHVIRSPLDTVSSLLNVSWWGSLELWTRDRATPDGLTKDPAEQAMLAAEIWVRETAAGLRSGSCLPPGQYLEIRYEDLVANPAETLGDLVAALGLPRSRGFLGPLGTWEIRSSVDAYRSRLSPQQTAAVTEAATSLASDLGYSI